MGISLKKYIKIRNNKLLNQEIQLRFMEQLFRLLKNGYSLLDALEVMKWDKHLIQISSQIIKVLKEGDSIDQAFDQANFHHSITNYLYFARTNGDIETSLHKCITMYRNRLNYIKKFRQIIRYPLILFILFSFLLYFIKQYVLPSFIDIFLVHSESSTMVILLMMFIDFFGTLLLVVLIIVMIVFILWQFYKRKISIEKQIRLYNLIPIFRNIIRIQTSFVFATHLSTLLKTGMPIKEILQNMSQQKKLPIVAYYSSVMTMELSRGLPLVNLLPQLSLLESQLSIIFQKNTNTDALEKDLSVFSEMLTDELHRKIMKIITYIQPLFFITLASFIVFIYITLMWPMFELIKTI